MYEFHISNINTEWNFRVLQIEIIVSYSDVLLVIKNNNWNSSLYTMFFIITNSGIRRYLHERLVPPYFSVLQFRYLEMSTGYKAI